MSDFYETWNLVRTRFENELTGLSQEQLNWRLHPGSLTIGESALHVAGVEISFLTQLTGADLSEVAEKVRRCSTEGVVHEGDFPFAPSEITPELVAEALKISREMVEPNITNLTDELRAKTLKSALGPVIDGTGAFARLAYHPGYHQGQVYMLKIAPGFPN